MTAKIFFLNRMPDARSVRERKAIMYLHRQDRVNVRERLTYGILAAGFVLLAMAGIIILIMWNI